MIGKDRRVATKMKNYGGFSNFKSFLATAGTQRVACTKRIVRYRTYHVCTIAQFLKFGPREYRDGKLSPRGRGMDPDPFNTPSNSN